MDASASEPNDNHSYSAVWLRPRTVDLVRKGFARYQALLESDILALKEDPELVALVDDVESLPIAQEAQRISGIGAWLDEQIGESRDDHGRDLYLNLTHGYVRLTKSVAMLYVRHLRTRRDALAQRPAVSTHLLSSVDTAIAHLEESMNSGVFRLASESPLLVSDITSPPEALARTSAQEVSTTPRTILLPSIELLDSELRSRCVDLFANFAKGGQHDRLDTVVTEATRILEDRLRRVSAAPPEIVGVALAKFAFAGEAPRIQVSEVPAEQEAAHLMFRGLFGFVRNHVHHRLTGPLEPQRVLQILGMIDYLLSLSGPPNAIVNTTPS